MSCRRNIGLLWLLVLFTISYQGVDGIKCPDAFFSCKVSGNKDTCLHNNHLCDGKEDCQNGVDENNCGTQKCEEPEFFSCRNGKCVSSFYRCDGEDDCGDYSDEENCEGHEHPTPEPVACTSEEWRCVDDMCIPQDWVCNQEQDCLDGSDEIQGCSHKLSCKDGYMCANKQCIPNEWACDGNKDCSDGSDEKNCNSKSRGKKPEVPTKECTMDRGLFLCNDKLNCLEFNEVCSGTAECLDGSDEGAGCKIDVCSAANCSHACLRTPAGPVCYCPTGYELAADKNSCIDTDECNEFGICSQRCLNVLGSYKCLCDDGYKLEDNGHDCTVLGGEVVLYFTTKRDVRGIFLTSNIKFTVGRNKLKHVVGVSYDGLHVYWTSVVEGEEAIVRSKEDGSEMEAIISAGLSLPEDVALDWVTGNIYFSDSQEHHIAVCSSDGAHCVVLAREEQENYPRAIALLVPKGLMYWSRWGKSPAIMQAGMDGSNPRKFISKNIDWPNGIAFDYPNNRLYWVDAKMKNIESVHFDGSDRRMVLGNVVKHPYGIAVFENSLYWSDYLDRTIFRCDKFTGRHVETIVKERKGYVFDLHVYHSSGHATQDNPCSKVECSDLCLLAPNATYECACPAGKKLKPDLHNCMAITKLDKLIVGAGNKLFEIYHQELGKQHVLEIKSKSIGAIGDLTYNSLTGDIVISDIAKKKVYTLNLETNKLMTLLNATSGTVEGIDFDYLGNNLYWCDSERATVEVLSLTTMERTTVIRDFKGDVPINLALVPMDGAMFVCVRSNTGIHIDRYLMDGSSHTHAIEEVLKGPNIAMTYDSEFHRVFWADSGRSMIESTDAEGMDLHSYKKVSGTPSDIASIGQDMFWINQNSGDELYWSNKYTGDAKNKHISLDINDDVKQLRLVTASKVLSKPSHTCQSNNGGCSHVCLLSLKNIVCGCPIGMRLKPDGKTCVYPTRCSRDQFKCTKDDTCIKKELQCDKNPDCPSGEDEEDCATHCSASEYQCKDGSCIKAEKRCNQKDDCADGSDEQNCITAHCRPNEYQCTSGQCILSQWRCDFANDCADGSDEEFCSLDVTCSAKQFRCKSGTCISAAWECDGRADCIDSSDEHALCRPPTCRSDELTCNNGRCISTELVCDGTDDCNDNSDEWNCPEEKTSGRESAPTTCPSGHFFCNSAPDLCPLESEKCNGVADCPRGEDERNCGCADQEFECANGRCITAIWHCDGADDCGDSSDERDCSTAEPASVKPACKEYTCGSGECVKLDVVCDDKPDCKDKSDEAGICATACAAPHPCGGVCHPTPNGPRCSCAAGFTLNGTSCLDIDECKRDICSQLCYNTPGSYKCSCGDEYRLRTDHRSCKAIGSRMQFLFSAGYQVRQAAPDLSNLEVVLSDPGRTITGLDVDVASSDIYLSNRLFGTLTRMNLVTKEEAVLSDIGQPGKLAFDWLTKNVYVIDEGIQETIKVCNFDTKFCSKIVFVEFPTKVSALTIDPTNKCLFWAFTSYWKLSAPTAAVYRSNLLGSEVEELVSGDLSLVTGLALDLVRQQVYIADQHLQRIEVVGYNGQGKKTVFKQGVQHPIALAMFEDYLLWLGSGSGLISRCRVLGLPPRKCDELRIHSYNAEHLVILQDSRQPEGLNVCANHTCATVCVPRIDVPQCLCSNGTAVTMGTACTESNVDMGPTVARVDPGSGGAVTGVLVALLFVVLAGVGYYVYRYRLMHGTPPISMYFKNPTFGFNPKDVAATPLDHLKPGEHQYGNPLAGNNPNSVDMVPKAKKTVEFEDQESETDSVYSLDDRLRLVN